MVDTDLGAIPIEVKSGMSYRMHAAIDHVLDSADYGLNEGIVLSRANVETDKKVVYLPLYTAGLIRELYTSPLTMKYAPATW